jgi:hypothetical protein
VVACGSGKGNPAAPAVTAAAATAGPATGAAAIPKAVLDVFYPEFAASGLSVKESFSPRMASGTPVTVYNLTDRKMRQPVIQALYAMMEDFSRQPQVLPGFEAMPDTSIAIRRRAPASVSLVLIPEGVLKPRSTASDFIRTRNPPANTTIGRSGDLFTFVQVSPGLFADGSFAAVPDFATFNFGVEICQELIRATVVDQRGITVDLGSAANDAQELVCNSLGGAVAAAALGLSYEKYEAFAQAHPIRLSAGSAPAIVIDEESYADYPQTGPIIQ